MAFGIRNMIFLSQITGMGFIPGSNIESNYNIFIYKYSQIYEPAEKCLQDQFTVYRIHLFTRCKFPRNQYLGQHCWKLKLRQNFSLDSPICPHLPTIITRILCVFDSYHIAAFQCFFFPIAFGIEYYKIFSDFQVFMVYFPQKNTVWKAFIQ